MNKANKKTDKLYSYLVDLIVILIALVANIILYTVGNIIGLDYYYYDEYDYSLSGTTDELFKDAIAEGKTVKISFCMAESDVKNHSTGSEVYQTAKNFEERYPEFIELDYINIITRQDKDGNLVNLSKYKTDMLGNETPIYKSSIIFECGENYRVITDNYTATGYSSFYNLDSSMYITSYNGEEVMASMISWVAADEHKTAYFTMHHGETADIAFTNLLSCAGYYVEVIDLRKQAIPEDADLLVISNPTSDFEAAREGSDLYTEIDRLKAYVERGGKLYVALDPYVKTLTVLEGFLAEYGIRFSVSEAENGKKIRNMIKDSRNAITADGFTLIAEYAESDIAGAISSKTAKYSDGSVIVREVSALELSENAKPILVSSSASVLEAGGKTVSSVGGYCIAACAEVVGESGNTAKLFVIPSVYLGVSDALVSREYSNKDFIYSLFENLFGNENMPYGCRAIMYNSQTLENLTMGTARIYTVIVMLIPAAIAITGAVILIKRKNR